MANPRKFSEKIALHNQKQAEETAAFEQIMREVGSATRNVQAKSAKNGKSIYQKDHLHINPALGPYRGGSLPNVNQIGNNSIDLQGALICLEDIKQGREGLERGCRESPSRHSGARRSRQFDKRVDSSPYGSVYLSPPLDTSWRRANSDSALHQSTMNQADNYHSSNTPPNIRRVPEDGMLTFDGNFVKGWDTKKDSSSLLPLIQSRPKSCEVPGINIYHSEQEPGVMHIPISNSTGSLPDLTNLQFPSPLATPIDAEEQNIAPFSTNPDHQSMGSLSPSLGGLATQCPGSSQLSRKRIQHNLSNLVVGDRDNQVRQQQQLQQQQSSLRVPALHNRYLHTCKGLAVESQPVDAYKQQSQYSLYHSSQPLGISSSQQAIPSSHMGGYRSGSPADATGSAPQSPVSQSFSLSSSPSLGVSPKTLFDQQYYLQTQVQSVNANSVQQRFEEFNLIDNVPASSINSVFLSSGNGLHYSQAQSAGQDLLDDVAYYGTSAQLAQYSQTVQSPVMSGHHQQTTPQTPQTPNSIPDIVLTDFSTACGGSVDSISRQDFVKDISSAMVGMTGPFDSDLFPSDEALKVGLDPIDLQMLTDPDLVADPATEDSFRLDRL